MLRKIFPFTTVAFLVAALYVGWTFYSRHEANRHAQEGLDAKQAAARKKWSIRFTAREKFASPLF